MHSARYLTPSYVNEMHPLLDTARIDESPADFLRKAGEVFAVWDAQTQDSGNISYGVRCGEERFFAKTAGAPDDPRPHLSHPDRVALLRNAVRLRASCDHPALPRLHRLVESPQGPLLVYAWLEGELVGARRAEREDPRSAFQRFRALPPVEILAALDTVFELHGSLAGLGWTAVDFYDGCLVYDFAARRLGVVDLDNYHQGPFTNRMGRMFGSTRFMAPEEFVLGAPIDERTNVFTMGRTAAVLLSDGTLERTPFRGSDAEHAVVHRACSKDPDKRFPTMASFLAAWSEARPDGGGPKPRAAGLVPRP